MCNDCFRIEVVILYTYLLAPMYAHGPVSYSDDNTKFCYIGKIDQIKIQSKKCCNHTLANIIAVIKNQHQSCPSIMSHFICTSTNYSSVQRNCSHMKSLTVFYAWLM